jgi:hypothetical protein
LEIVNTSIDTYCALIIESGKMPIPSEIAAEVLFKSDRTCCVCRIKNKPVQIHHIDGNHENNKIDNLSVLCLECHTETQITGGFHRKLTADLVTLYRDDWLMLVSKERISNMVALYNEGGSSNLEMVTSIVEDLNERKEFMLLAMFYDTIGNQQLRDKYIEITLSKKQTPETEIFLRALQNKISLVNPEIIETETKRLMKNEDWSQLGRFYVDIEDWRNAAKYYSKGIIRSIDEGRPFSAAFYLKEAYDEKIHEKLFQQALKTASDNNDLWWQVRALQELGWTSELDQLLLNNEEKIKQSGDENLLAFLYASLNDQDNHSEILKKMWKKTRENDI